MDTSYFAAAATLATIKAPASVSADGNTTGFELTPYFGKIAFMLSALNTAGTNPTMAIKLQSSADADLIGAITGTRTGNGSITELCAMADAVTEAVTLTFTSATAFSVVGGTTSAMAAGTVGTKYIAGQLEFMVTAGTTAFEVDDTIVVAVTGRTWADVSGVAFTGLTTGASLQRITADVDKLPRFARFNMDIGGTAGPVYTIGIALLGLKQ